MTNLDEERRRFIERQLRILQQAFEAGNEGALHEAARFCVKMGVVPSWVMEALIARQVDYMMRLSRGKGRHARWITAYRQDRIDYDRYEAVLEAKERKEALSVVWTDGKIYEVVAAALKWSPSKGKPRDIEESYLRVRRQIQADPWRYMPFGYLRIC